MESWNSFPLLKILPPFLIGVIGTAFAVELIDWQMLNVAYVIAFVMLFAIVILAITYGFRIQRLFGVFASVVMVCCGIGLTLSVSESIFPESLKVSADDTPIYLAKVVNEPQLNTKTVKVRAKLATTDLHEAGTSLLYLAKDSLAQSLSYGDVLVLNTNLQPVENLGNPNEFNYKRYLRFNGIAHRGYVKNGDVQVLNNEEFSIRGWFFEVRSKLIDKLKEAKLSGNELSVASALILGYRTDLDKELMSAYAGAGATHVLAVSGLHVGIVYVILNSVLKFMDRRKRLKVIKTLLLILMLFGYAALTGLSASVFRAATMFSFVAIGQAIERNTNIFNTLAASAFCLIAYEPMIVMQVGFQLSYAAVIGIVIIQPRLFKLFTFENRALDWAWSITCVSVAAQIATFPLGLLYFHQFPNLFLLSNLLVIPAAAGILYLGFSLFLFSFWEPTLLYFGFLLDSLISALNTVVVWIESVPYSVLSGIDISIYETLIVYLIIGSLLLFFTIESRKGLYASLVLAICFMVLQVIEVSNQKSQKFATLYNVKKETALALVDGTHVTFLSSKSFYDNEQAMLFHIKHHWWKLGIETESFIELNDTIENRALNWGDKVIAVVNLDKFDGVRVEKGNVNLNLMVVSNIDFNSPNTWGVFDFDKVAFSSQLSPGKTKVISMSNYCDNCLTVENQFNIVMK